jgi:hypothetical protein
MVQIAEVCQRFACERARSMLMNGSFSVCENGSDAGVILCAARNADIGAAAARDRRQKGDLLQSK